MPSVQIHADVIDSITNTPERQDSTGRHSGSEGQPLVTASAGTSSMAANASAGAEAQEVTATPSPPVAPKQKWSLAAMFRSSVEEASRSDTIAVRYYFAKLMHVQLL
jgi:hypothetical protein